ncbi:MAG: Stf0 family sulfotransferase [Pseudomonadota bacterium]
MICTSPRSGSTLLCRLLRETGVAGRPGSYFHGDTLEAWAENLDLPNDPPDMTQIIDAALRKGRAGGSVFGVRQQSHSFALLCQTLAETRTEKTDRQRLEAVVGPLRYIHLTRANKLDQAISLIRAEQSGIWHKNADGSIYEELAPRRSDGYDFAVISEQIADLEAADEAWRAWFDRESIEPLTITYDALSADPNGVLVKVLEWIGLSRTHADDVQPPTKKLADETTAQWIARYRLDAGHE